MISNGLVALAGGLLAQYQGFADINMGRGAIVIGLAAVIIGEVIFGTHLPQLRPQAAGRRHSAPSSTTWSCRLVLLARASTPNDLKLLTALIVALFLAVPYLEEANTLQQSLAERRRSNHA